MQTVLVVKKNGKNNRSLWDHGFVFEQLGGYTEFLRNYSLIKLLLLYKGYHFFIHKTTTVIKSNLVKNHVKVV